MSIHPDIPALYAGIHDVHNLNNPDASDTAYSLHNGLYFPHTRDHREALRNMNRFVETNLDLKPLCTVMDLGCGVGSLAFYLVRNHPDIQVFAANITGIQLTFAQWIKNKRQIMNISFMMADYLRNPILSESMDRVLFMESLSHAQNPQQVLTEAYRLVKPGGKALICDILATSLIDSDRIRKFRNTWQGNGILPISRLREYITDAGFIEYDLDLTPWVLASQRHLACKQHSLFDPAGMVDGLIEVYELTQDRQLGYFAVHAWK